MTDEQKQKIHTAIRDQSTYAQDTPQEAAEAIAVLLQEAFEFEQAARDLADTISTEYVLEVIGVLQRRVLVVTTKGLDI